MSVRAERLLAAVAMVVGMAVGSAASAAAQGSDASEARSLLGQLVAAHGASGDEARVRAAVTALLPSWADPRTDAAGNLHVRVGEGAPLVVFVAHLDEVGWRVTAIGEDGRLALERLGGFDPAVFEARPALVHADGAPVPVVIAPRGAGARSLLRDPGDLVADPGTGSAAATATLGIRPGQAVTVERELIQLANGRVAGRALDDRVGSAALVLALRRLDRAKLRHEVLFLWSVREEVGLEGAAAAAAELAGERVARVHAVDTFVSSDAPLERRTFAYAPLGGGAVVRAVDGSNVAPPALVDSLVGLARRRDIPLQVGATGGGNDGSVFVPFGVPDVPVGWPLRYSHSPVETADLADVTALADLVRAIAEEW